MKLSKSILPDHRGFAAFEALIIVLVVGVLVGVGVLVSRRHSNIISKNSDQSQRQASETTNEPDLVIHNFGLQSLNSVDINQQATRTFKETGHKGFYVFGDPLPGTPVRHNPNFEFASLKPGTQIISAIDGVVGFIKYQEESKDNEVFLMPNENSNWIIGYDHLTDLKVAKGDKVRVGTVLGVPARQNNGLLRFEFQVNKNKNGQDGMHICPSTLLATDVKEKALQSLQTMQVSWESTTSLDLYDLSKQQPVGCIETQMTPAYASGQS